MIQAFLAMAIFTALSTPIAWTWLFRGGKNPLGRRQVRIRALLVLIALVAISLWAWLGFIAYGRSAG